MVSDSESIKKLAEELEKQELNAPDGVPSPQVYAQLLAIYLYQNDLCNAKFIWKRIPPHIKSSHAELSSIWKVGQKMWQRDFPGVYAALNVEWSDVVTPIMKALQESVQKRAIYLVARAYSSIKLEDLAAFLGMTAEQSAEAVLEHGWQIDSGRMVKPCAPPPDPNDVTSSEEQLYKLTEFVSFLEN